jgi:hypothetical protein
VETYCLNRSHVLSSPHRCVVIRSSWFILCGVWLIAVTELYGVRLIAVTDIYGVWLIAVTELVLVQLVTLLFCCDL